ncbi:MAG TPA: sugar MFS transporter [Sunxiuqinia sp.]|nr:sugar MFS transporter [Sunxiuqinia sp.]
MASNNTVAASIPSEKNTGTSRSIIMIGILFFIFGFVTWLNSVLIPYLKISCELNNLESFMVAFSFYISYLVMAVPSAKVLKFTGFKKGMSLGLGVMAGGALIFIPAALSRTYGLFLLGLFTQGIGLAILQTAANPYIIILGPRESAAQRISIMGICNKFAGAVAPIILGTIALKNVDPLVARLDSMSLTQKKIELDALASRVIVPYLIMAGVLVLLAVWIYLSSLPEVDTDQEDETVAKANTNKKSVFQFPHLLIGTLTMFLYVGVEVLAGDSVVLYAKSQGIALSSAKFFATATMSGMIVGYLVGIIAIPKYVTQEKALKISAIVGLVMVSISLFTHGFVSVLFISLLGLANALMYPAIFPLAIAGLGRFTKIGSSFLIMALSGGAIISLLFGYLADVFSPHHAYWIVVPCYLVILYFAVKGHQLKKAH